MLRDMVRVNVRVRFRPKKMNWPIANGADVVFAVTHLDPTHKISLNYTRSEQISI